MDRNDMVVGQAVDRAVLNTVQDGIKLDVKTGDETLDADLLARWNEWANDPSQCDLAGELTFHAMEGLVLRSVFVDGDILALPTVDGALQLVEAHRLRTPRNTKRNVIHGVLLDENRRRLEYWLTKDDISPDRPVERVSDIKRYPARDEDGYLQVFHIYNPKRVTQTRGVTAFAPIFDAIGMHDDIQFAKLVQQQIVSCFAIFRQRELDFAGGASPQTGARTTESLADGTTRTIEGIAPGMLVEGAPGETLHGFSPNVPNPEWFPQTKLILTFIGINLGLPLVMVLMDASETNFSGWRGAIEQARMGFKRNQRLVLIERFHRPVYLWKVRQWLAEDAALRRAAQRRGINIFRHEWHPPTWPYIQPLQDASADLLRVRNGLLSHRRRSAERGLDWDDLSTEIVEDNALAIAKAKRKAAELNAEFEDGQPVHWRELLSLPTPDGVRVNITTAAIDEEVTDERSA